MLELYNYCSESNNNADHRQARIFQRYIIASLLGGDLSDVRFYTKGGIWYRHASFEVN